MNLEDKTLIIMLASSLSSGKDLIFSINSALSRDASKNLCNSLVFVRKSLELGYTLHEVLDKKEANSIPNEIREILKLELSNEDKGRAIIANYLAPKPEESNVITQEFYLFLSILLLGLIILFYLFRFFPLFAEIVESLDIKIPYLLPFSPIATGEYIIINYLILFILISFLSTIAFLQFYFHAYLGKSLLFYFWKKPCLLSEMMFVIKLIQLKIQNNSNSEIDKLLYKLSNPILLPNLHKILSQQLGNNSDKNTLDKKGLDLDNHLFQLIFCIINQNVEHKEELELYYSYLNSKLEFYQNSLVNIISLILKIIMCIIVGFFTYLVYNIWVVITKYVLSL